MLDFAAQFSQYAENGDGNYLYLFKNGVVVASSINKPYSGDSSVWSSMPLIYRDKVTSPSFFEFKFYSNGSGGIAPLDYKWGYKLYAGSTYPFNN